ncbi:MAG TPA: EF-hand domain-containing protein [Brevundimonas sp.]|uniref:EF-hand domain-containing protein n=1 Tax=Brevundimonas sp. TaxID=1871086 RepID=UPI002615085B|nr:EF-hand domain-containing protein [Brevundimonas sp.]HRO32589.1 EF-hand domain-containing protein [Brevundimonas sp.]
MKTIVTAACTAALLLTAGVAAAQQTTPQNAPARMARVDADRDGRLSQAEYLARFDRMAAMDANGDGVVSADERRAAMQARRGQQRTAAFDRLDADKDGVISRAEFEARPDRAPRARMMRRQGPRRGGDLNLAQARERAVQAFARMDRDGDGYVSADERRQSRQERRQASPAAPVSQ